MPPLASWGGAWPLGPPLKSATDAGRMQVDLVGWLHIDMVYPPEDGHEI